MKTIILLPLLFWTAFVHAQIKQEKPVQDTTVKEKTYTVKLTETQINALYTVLVFSKSALPTSQAPANQVSETLRVMDALEGLIIHQYQEQAKPQPKK